MPREFFNSIGYSMMGIMIIVLMLLASFVVTNLIMTEYEIFRSIEKWIYIILILIILIYMHVSFFMLNFFPSKLSSKELRVSSMVWSLLFFLNGLLLAAAINILFKYKRYLLSSILLLLVTFLFELFIGMVIMNAVCKFFNKKSVQIVEADSHISG